MVQKISSAMKSRSKKIIVGLQRKKKIAYYANPKFCIPITVVLPANSFYSQIEKHLRNEPTILPIADGKITWKQFVKYNRGFNQIKMDIIQAEERNFPDKAWDNVANRIVKMVKKHHQPVE